MSVLAELRGRYAPAATFATPATHAPKSSKCSESSSPAEAEKHTPQHLATRRQKARARLVQRLLRQHPDVSHYYYTDDRADPHFIVLTIGLQGVGTADILIPRETYDPFRVLEIMHGHRTPELLK